ncbi:hypothetical protein CKAN_02226400 [Cinnamomum micranthum f. kanehirae]|uniref:Uncharacterized protein n=1 Tax=Cinnamomum micranthum f. kanehirae TaxID=337451 RepID=A0A443PQI8_9MAGN|nr:hypothetical protein CKAN_02226400 [Cinnamomum micranthum f. kanehirae]
MQIPVCCYSTGWDGGTKAKSKSGMGPESGVDSARVTGINQPLQPAWLPVKISHPLLSVDGLFHDQWM